MNLDQTAGLQIQTITRLLTTRHTVAVVSLSPKPHRAGEPGGGGQRRAYFGRGGVRVAH